MLMRAGVLFWSGDEGIVLLDKGIVDAYMSIQRLWLGEDGLEKSEIGDFIFGTQLSCSSLR